MPAFIKNYFTFLFGSRRKYWLLGIAVLIFALYQVDRGIREDDDMTGEHVYFLLKEGKVKSELMHGYGNLQLEEHQTVFHKLFIYCGFVFAKIFGWSAYSLHAMSFFFLLVFFGILYRYFRANKEKMDLSVFCIMTVFLLICHNIIYYANCYRPEIMLMALGFFSFFQLDQYLRGKAGMPALLLSSVASGLAFATHPHGVIYIGAGCLLLLFNKKWGQFFLSGTVAAVVFAGIYFADILHYNHLDLFWFQVAHDPIINVQHHAWYTPLLKLLEEQARILYNEREVTITLLLVTGLIFNFRYLVKEYKNLLVYGLLLFILLGCYAYSKSPQYLLLYLPFTALIIALSWQHLEATGTNKYKIYLYRAMFIAYAVVHLLFAGKKIEKNITALQKPSYAEQNRIAGALIKEPHQQTSVLAYDGFVFDEIKSFKRIRTLTYYSFFAEMQGKDKQKLEAVIRDARTMGDDYLVLNRQYLDYFELDDKARLALKDNELFTITANNSDLLILKLRK